MNNITSKIKALDFYDESFIMDLEHKINNSDEEIRDAIKSWLVDKIEAEITVYDVSFTLLKKSGMDTIGAYLTLDWIKREPKKAISALKRDFYPVYEHFIKIKNNTIN